MDAPAPDISLRSTGRNRRRLLLNRAVQTTWIVAAVAAIAVLAIVVWSVLSRGIPALSLDFFTKGPSFFGTGGGIAPSIVGTIMLVGIAVMFALPTGVLTAIYVT